jgi:glutamate/tyrosine decarboxylase-like PLP-dependent enzyme
MKPDITNIDKILPLIHKYLSRGSSDNTPVVQYLDHETLKNELNLSIGHDGVSFEEILKEIETYLNFSVNTSHSQFLNQLFSGFNLPAFAGDVCAALTNTTMATFEAAPVATLMEETLVRKMCRLMGFEGGEGILVSGGSQANMIATLCARNSIVPQVKRSGLTRNKKLVMFVSDQSHYSFFNAANILGIGAKNVMKVKSDSYGRMIPGELEKSIKMAIQEGNTPFFIGATSGTTVLGSFDPLHAIAPIAQKYNIWFHVDACFGGSVILSSKYRHLLAGCERADSIAWDPHKMMSIPLICSVILVKKKGTLYKTCSASGTEYLFHSQKDSLHDLGRMSLQCARRVDSLKLWLAWKFHGDKGYDRIITNLFNLADYATQFVNKHSKLELLAPRNSVSVCFRYVVKKRIQSNHFTIMLRDQLHKTGKGLVNYASIHDRSAIRLMITNPHLTKKDIDHFFNNLLATAAELEKNWQDVTHRKSYKKRRHATSIG